MWPFRARGLRNSSGPGEGGTRNWQARADPAAPCCHWQPAQAWHGPVATSIARARPARGRASCRAKVVGRVGEHPAVGAALQPEPEVPRLLRFIDGGQRVPRRLGRTVRAEFAGPKVARWCGQWKDVRVGGAAGTRSAGGAAGVVRWQLSVRWERPPLRESRCGMLRCTAPKDGAPGRSPSRLPGPSGFQ
jgi:hypothetical protein